MTDIGDDRLAALAADIRQAQAGGLDACFALLDAALAAAKRETEFEICRDIVVDSLQHLIADERERLRTVKELRKGGWTAPWETAMAQARSA